MSVIKSEFITIHVVDALHKGQKHRLEKGASVSNLVNISRMGSSFRSGDVARGLTREEEKLYLPSIIGITPDSHTWEQKVREYWANISFDVTAPDNEGKGGGLRLEIGFAYPDEESAKAGEQERRTEWEKLRQTLLEPKDNDVREYQMSFEKRFKLGTPINLGHYIAFRYALIYSDVAKYPELASKSPKIRFYMTSPAYDEKQQFTKVQLRMTAMNKLNTIIGNEQKLTAILLLSKSTLDTIRLDEKKPYPVDTLENKIILLEVLCTKYPETFSAIADDEKLLEKALVERYINRKLLKRVTGTNTIMYGDNQIVGQSLEEVVTFLGLEINLPIKQELEARIKLAKSA